MLLELVVVLLELLVVVLLELVVVVVELVVVAALGVVVVVAAEPVTTTSWGAVDPVSRAARLVCVALVEVSATLSSPPAVTTEVTSALTQVPVCGAFVTAETLPTAGLFE